VGNKNVSGYGLGEAVGNGVKAHHTGQCIEVGGDHLLITAVRLLGKALRYEQGDIWARMSRSTGRSSTAWRRNAARRRRQRPMRVNGCRPWDTDGMATTDEVHRAAHMPALTLP
jgi:hypothetical protein